MSRFGEATSGLEKLRKGYRALALLALNTLILLVVLNGIASLLLQLSGRSDPGPLRYGMKRLGPVYPGWRAADLERMLRETWTRSYSYEPFTQFREAPHEGEFLNVHAAGFRLGSNPLAWPPADPDRTVFVFGGSTVFGYGLPDHQTIPAQLENYLRRLCRPDISVYNFGRSNYYSTQERILFEELLLQGMIPRIAVFLDGLNEFSFLAGGPKLTRRLDYLMQEKPRQLARRLAVNLPLARLLKSIVARENRSSPESSNPPQEEAEAVINRYLQNKKLIESAAETYGVKVLFAWQPVPFFDYDLRFHRFADSVEQAAGQRTLVSTGYRQMDLLRQRPGTLAEAGTFLWLPDLQANRTEPLYVDRVHYTAAFSWVLAEALGDRIEGLDCLPPPITGEG